MAKNKQTVGKVALRGKIYGLEKAKENMVDNEKQKKINFLVKTDEDNAHFVTVNQWKGGMKKAYLFKNTEDDDGNRTNEKKVVGWNERYNYVEDGFEPIGIKTKADTDSDTLSLYPFDFIDFLFENYNDGDSVFMRGEMTFSEGKNGVYKNIEPTQFYPTTNEVDFEDEDFDENSNFTLGFVFKGATPMDDKVFVEGFVFDWNETPILEKFVVENDMPRLQKHLVKEASYGNVYNIEGIIHNRVTYKEVEKTPEGEGFGKKTGSFNGYASREIDSERKELQVTYSDMPIEGVYSKADIEGMKNGDDGSNTKKDDNIKPEKSAKMPWQ